jgi:hypothetical protein
VRRARTLLHTTAIHLRFARAAPPPSSSSLTPIGLTCAALGLIAVRQRRPQRGITRPPPHSDGGAAPAGPHAAPRGPSRRLLEVQFTFSTPGSWRATAASRSGSGAHPRAAVERAPQRVARRRHCYGAGTRCADSTDFGRYRMSSTRQRRSGVARLLRDCRQETTWPRARCMNNTRKLIDKPVRQAHPAQAGNTHGGRRRRRAG